MAPNQLLYLINKVDQFSWLFLIDILLCKVFFNKVSICSIQKFFSRTCFSLQSQLSSKEWEENFKNHDSELSNCSENKKDDRKVYRDEVEKVMGNLGLFCSEESEKIKDSMSFDELSQLFDEKEPSLEEVKEAFDVFDENKDGFIDAEELQRVLCILGLKEGVEIQNCRNMIRSFDDNKDGRIDFNEFVKFMENILS